MHQTIANTLRALASSNPPEGIDSANTMIDTALAICQYATRSTIHGTLKGSPGALAFNRDMVFDIPFVADWELIRRNRQQLVDKKLIEANRKRFSYDYYPGNQVLKIVHNPDKLEPRNIGPYTIEHVHTNGTVTVRINPYTVERISIRRIKPYRQ
jgi:hypothetical protein